MADNLGLGNSSQSWTGSNPFLGQANPYLQGNIDQTMGDITRNYNNSVAPSTTSSMVKSGSFGNSGLDALQGEQQRQLAQTLGNTSNNMRAADYNQQQNMYQWDQGFNRNLFNDGVNQNQQNLSNYMGLLNQGNQFNQQDITNSTNMQNAPLNYQQAFSGMANSTGGMGGTSSSNTAMPGNSMLGAMGGWGLGNAVSNYFNPKTGA